MSEPIPKAAPAKPGLLTGAGVALLAGQVPWIWIIADQFRIGAAPLAVFNGLVTVAAWIVAVRLMKLKRDAIGAALIESYYVAFFSGYWAIRTGFWPLWLGVAGPAATVVLISLWQNAQPRPESRKAPPSLLDESLSPWLKENVEAIVVAFIMALVIRCFCIEVFKIPSSSMEPTLMGDAKDGSGRGGDRIMVTKYYYVVSDIERFDVVVFKFPLNQPRNFIKRVVGLPGEKFKIVDGDIYTCPRGGDAFRIARKSLRIQDSIWIDAVGGPKPESLLRDNDLFRQHWQEASPDGAAFVVHGGEISTQEKDGRRDVKFLLKEHSLNAGGASRLKDLRLAFDFEITAPRGCVFAEIRNAHGRFEARFSTDEPSSLIHTGPEKEDRVYLRDLKVAMDRRYRAELSVFDGMASVQVDGRSLGKVTFIETEEHAANRSGEAAPTVSFGARGLTFRARNLSVGRDIHYQEKTHIHEGKAVEVPEGHYVMMGDNVQFSHDSRAWTEWSYEVEGRREPIRCEGQETTDSGAERAFGEKLKEKYGLPSEPDVAIKGDEHGNEWALYRKGRDLEGLPRGAPVAIMEKQPERGEPFRFIDRKYIVGKAFWIWYPPGRWFRLIR